MALMIFALLSGTSGCSAFAQRGMNQHLRSASSVHGKALFRPEANYLSPSSHYLTNKRPADPGTLVDTLEEDVARSS
jgi:hypothetical protein